MGGQVDLEVVVAQDERFGGHRRVAPPQHRAHPEHQLPGRERLGDVVVRSELEPDQPVGLVAQSGEHDHRDRGDRPQSPEHLEAVNPGALVPGC